jgi:hypothetical protein
MSDALLLGEMYRQLLETTIAAFAGQHYEVAYHAFSGAMHAANDLGEDAKLAAVELLAHKQHDWIETHAADHLLADRAAVRRGNSSIYATLLVQLAIMRHLLQKKSRRLGRD